MTAHDIEILDDVINGQYWLVTRNVRNSLSNVLDELDAQVADLERLRKKNLELSATLARYVQHAQDNHQIIDERTREIQICNSVIADLQFNATQLQTAMELADNDVDVMRQEVLRLQPFENACEMLNERLRQAENEVVHLNFLLLSIQHILNKNQTHDRHNPD